MDSVLFPYYRHLTALLEGANKQLPENAARLGVKQSPGFGDVQADGTWTQKFWAPAKPVILGTCLAPLSLSAPICKVGTITSIFSQGQLEEIK